MHGTVIARLASSGDMGIWDMGCGVRGANGTLGSCDGSLPIVMPYTVVSEGDRAQALPSSIMTLVSRSC